MPRNIHPDQAVFGPVPSRRLGLSLGVDLLTPKTCTLDCVYCELGPTTNRTVERGRFRDAAEVLAQVRSRLAELDYPPDFITLAGSGEPTLHRDMGLVLSELRKMSRAKLAVLTNATLMSDPRVRAELALADVAAPSLDAVSPSAFRRVNRPHPDLRPEDIIKGLTQFRREFTGRLWLEILLVAGLNDDDDEIARLAEAAGRIEPDSVQLNTVVRPPAVKGFAPVDHERLTEIAARFPVPCQVIAPPEKTAGADRGRMEDEVVEMTRRRPCTVTDIAAMAGLETDQARRLLDDLVKRGKMKTERFDDRTYYRGVN
jgi:wyosine [tRNA(Phe)-imidazoG37] synthetase (radical SAM superfamily)